MEEKQKRLLTVLFILMNLVIWGIFIVPRIGKFSAVVSSNLVPQPAAPIIQRNENAIELLQRVDFHTLRDPFKIVSAFRQPDQQRPVTTHRSSTTTSSVPPWAGNSSDQQTVERTFTSRFKLVSVMQFENSFIATLEEASHYGSGGGPSGVPYSYRFGGGQDTSSQSASTYMVIEGDSVMDETVAKITKDYVVMKKDGLYYKLTFSGGFPVSAP